MANLKASDNPFPSILIEEATEPAAPAAGHQRLYVDSTTHVLMQVNSAGTETPVAGAAGAVATDAIWDAKGDLAGGTGANTASKLTVGANDTILMADSGQTTGLKWVASQTPSTQAFSDAAAEGTADTYARGDHKHAMPASPGGGGAYGTPERTLVDPTGLSWSWVNQGSASIATQGAALYLTHAANASDSHHIRVKALANSKPYTEIFHVTTTTFPVDYSTVMVGWLQTSNNFFTGCALFSQSGAKHLASAKSGTNYSITANYTDLTGDHYQWIALCDDATNRRIWVSRDGNNWLLLHTVATNDFLTPDRIFFSVNPRNSGFDASVLVDSVETHTGSTP